MLQYITPFTTLLGDAVIQGINASNIVDEIDQATVVMMRLILLR